MATAGRLDAQLLERDAETERIERALARAAGGRGTLVVVEGPAGIGKTALMAHARGAAAAAGMRVLHARARHSSAASRSASCASSSSRRSRRPARKSARTCCKARPRSPDCCSRCPWLRNATSRQPRRILPSRCCTAFYWLTANLAAGRPLCLVVDDAHWADRPSLRYVAFLLARLEELPVALVVAARPNEPGSPAEQLGALATDPWPCSCSPRP